MKITTTRLVGPISAPEPKYPYIGEYTDKNKDNQTSFILFTGPSKGFRLNAYDENYPVGYASDRWMETLYTPLRGSITLTQ